MDFKKCRTCNLNKNIEEYKTNSKELATCRQCREKNKKK